LHRRCQQPAISCQRSAISTSGRLERELGGAGLRRTALAGAPRLTETSTRRRLRVFEMRRCLGQLVGRASRSPGRAGLRRLGDSAVSFRLRSARRHSAGMRMRTESAAAHPPSTAPSRLGPSAPGSSSVRFGFRPAPRAGSLRSCSRRAQMKTLLLKIRTQRFLLDTYKGKKPACQRLFAGQGLSAR
jgi:hypothetical protein